MLIKREFEVAASDDDVWKFLNDIPKVTPCLPGADLIEIIDHDTYKGRVLGPMSLRFVGTARVVERNDALRRMVIEAHGSEDRGRGQASMTITSTVASTARGSSRVYVTQELTLLGAAAQFGHGLVTDVSSVLVRAFATNLQLAIDREIGHTAASSRHSAVPTRHFSLGFSTALLGLKRFVQRLFGRGSAG